MTTIILNPVAGAKQRTGMLFEQVRAFVAQHRLDVEVLKTIAPGDGQHLAAVALKKGRDHVIAMGGDGTVHEVLNGIVGQGGTLGIVPTGTVNGIARALGLPLDWRRALPIALRGGARDVPVGTAAGRAFLGTAGLGIEVKTQGAEAQASVLQRAVRDGRAVPMRLQIDGSLQIDADILGASVTVSGGRASFAFPPAHLADDGRLSLTLVTARRDGGTDTTRLRCSTVEILSPSDVAMHVDGEVRRATGPVLFALAPERQRMLASGVDPG